MNDRYWNKFRKKQEFQRALEREYAENVNEAMIEYENSEELQKELDKELE